MVQDFAQNYHCDPPLTPFPNTFHSIPDFDQNCQFGPLWTCPERKCDFFQKFDFFQKLSSNPRLEFNQIYHFGPLQTFPD